MHLPKSVDANFCRLYLSHVTGAKIILPSISSLQWTKKTITFINFVFVNISIFKWIFALVVDRNKFIWNISESFVYLTVLLMTQHRWFFYGTSKNHRCYFKRINNIKQSNSFLKKKKTLFATHLNKFTFLSQSNERLIVCRKCNLVFVVHFISKAI